MKIAFDPIADNNSKILILGTMPGEDSLRKQEYYGHKNNHFWTILFTLFGSEYNADYSIKINLLKSKGIALWDVLRACEREGSADSKIKNEEANNFASFFSKYPQIKHVFFASKQAEIFYHKYVCQYFNLTYSVLPSPSSANARMSLSQKIESWEVILAYL